MPYRLLRPLLFTLDPETAHRLATLVMTASARLGLAGWFWRALGGSPAPPSARCRILGMDLTSPVGLAAGLDKTGEWVRFAQLLGAGFIEVGSVTLRPRAGNPRPRLRRIVSRRALVNWMGLPNQGVDAVVETLRGRPAGLGVGLSIVAADCAGREEAIGELASCYARSAGSCDYVAVNLSCPNTGDGRSLEDPGALREIGAALGSVAGPPWLAKVSPDLDDAALEALVSVEGPCGFVLVNTTTGRPGLTAAQAALVRRGGLSGRPLAGRALEAVRRVRAVVGPGKAIVGVGGIMTPEDAVERMAAGADLVQVFTGFLYEGPALLAAIARRLAVAGVSRLRVAQPRNPAATEG